MESSPYLINKNYINKKVDKASAINQLISIIEDSENLSDRIESINILAQMKANTNEVFKLVENLLISDTKESVRLAAASTMEKIFLNDALEPLRWAFKHEESLKCLLAISKLLGKIDSVQSKSLIMEKINEIKNEKIVESLLDLDLNGNFEKISSYELSRIVENSFIIKDLENKFGQISFKVKNGLILQLDLSDVSSHVFGWTILKKFPEFIEFLTSLEQLDLKFNRLSTIPDSIGTLTSLIELDLSYNKIKSIPSSIGSLKSLKVLNLRYNKIRSLPESIGYLNSLQSLNLRANSLKNLPKTIKNIPNLKMLDLHGNKLSNAKFSLKGSTKMERLDLGLNSIEKLPKWIKNLKYLTYLGLGGNKLTSLPKWIGSFRFLESLHLFDNRLSELPESLGTLINLEELTLWNNQLSTLPESIQKLKKLKKLNLSWNIFTDELPTWIGSLTSLEILSLWGNGLKLLPKSLENLTNLKILDLNFNNIKEIPPFLNSLEKNGLIIYK